MSEYNHQKIEKRWQKEWEKTGIYEADDKSSKKKFYPLVEFPFPSGAGLHTGHIRSYTAMDTVARKRRMQGENVLYPMGWDAFGLPTESYAIKTGIQPKDATKQNTDTFRKQLKSLGFSFDWSREVDTTDSGYYKWTQWIFEKMFEKGLAYKTKIPINWCPKDKIGLANEEVVDGCCDRCGTPVEKREKEQWMLAITKYADRLYNDLDGVDYLPRIKIQQRNWIGRSEGALIKFPINNSQLAVEVFTTRPDTLFGVTYIVLSPEHELVSKFKNQNEKSQFKIKNWGEVEKYVNETKKKTEIERTDAKKEKTGVELKGIKALNPVNGEEVSVWIADYVLADYGTGAVMAVPAHDDRDFEFAKKYNLPIKEVIIERMVDKTNPHVPGKEIVFRDAIIAVVWNPKNNKFLCLKWKKQPWITFVMGGIENNEDPVVAAMREIREETGYKNIKLKKILRRAQSEFFAAHKGVNRVAHTRNIIFELENEEKENISQEESEIHEIVWMSLDEISKTKMTHSEMPIFYEWFNNTEKAYTGEGILINSGEFSKKSSEEVKKDITKSVGGEWVVKYKLRDWVFSRQRYWGEPIPMIWCEKCGWLPVPEKDLPVTLPVVKKYEPTDTGESPLSTMDKWVNVKCPKCKGAARRETDTMPNWAGSSWYYIRYVDPKNKKVVADRSKVDQWLPVDWYNGGMEHTTLHLLYSRFWHKFLFDLGLVNTNEPYSKRTSHGFILAEGGEKMSKSRGNVVNPDELVEVYGADSLRLYEMFMGPFDQAIVWNSKNIIGPRRFVERVWKIADRVGKADSMDVSVLLHKTVKKVGEDIEAMGFNTAVSALMVLQNELDKLTEISKETLETYLKIVAPFAPHITEDIWRNVGNKKSIHVASWPKYDESLLKGEMVKVAVQVNGKTRGVVELAPDADENTAKTTVLSAPEIAKWLSGQAIKKVIYVPGRIVNIIVNPIT